jgi:hypothetical protein
MEESDFRDGGRLSPPAWSNPSNAPAGNADIQRASNDPSSAFQCGLASLMVGCAIGLASPITIVAAAVTFHHGPHGIPTVLAFVGGLIGVIIVAAGAVVSLIFGIYGWLRAGRQRASLVLPMAGTAASAVGLLVWIIAAIVLLMVLGGFIR